MTYVDELTKRKLTKGKIAQDGEVVHVPLMMMDHADPAALAAMRSLSLKDSKPQVMHRPGQLVMADIDRCLRFAARETRIAQMNDAWRNPAPLADKKIVRQNDAKPDPTTAYQARCARLRDAWKNTGGQ